jgi:hypothetical protein
MEPHTAQINIRNWHYNKKLPKEINRRVGEKAWAMQTAKIQDYELVSIWINPARRSLFNAGVFEEDSTTREISWV